MASTGFDVALNDGKTAPTLAEAGLSATATANCTFSVTADTTIMCTIVKGPATVATKTITLTRASDGSWTCATTVLQKLVGPSGVCLGT